MPLTFHEADTLFRQDKLNEHVVLFKDLVPYSRLV